MATAIVKKATKTALKAGTSRRPDSEVLDFEAALLRSVEQAIRGQSARAHTPADIVSHRAAQPGRPLGSTKVDANQAVTVRYSPDVLEAFRATGAGWQARMNDALREWLQPRSLN